MGDTKKIRKKYAAPRHPWIKGRIESEHELKKEFGLPRNKEVWKMETILTKFKDQTKKLMAIHTEQAEKERQQLKSRLMKYGLLQEEDALNKTLDVTLPTLLERRLQTVVFRLGLANSVKQARQFITHRHITVGGKLVTAPSYLVPIAEEATVAFTEFSVIADEDHPARTNEAPVTPAPVVEDKKEEKTEAKTEEAKEKVEKTSEPAEKKEEKPEEPKEKEAAPPEQKEEEKKEEPAPPKKEDKEEAELPIDIAPEEDPEEVKA